MEILTQNASTYVLDLVCQDLNILAACSIADYTRYCGFNTKKVKNSAFLISCKKGGKISAFLKF